MSGGWFELDDEAGQAASRPWTLRCARQRRAQRGLRLSRRDAIGRLTRSDPLTPLAVPALVALTGPQLPGLAVARHLGLVGLGGGAWTLSDRVFGTARARTRGDRP